MLKAALEKIVHGLLVGIGFAIAIAAVMFGYSKWQMKEFKERQSDMPVMFKHYSPEAGLAIKEHRQQAPQANSTFLGTIQNSGQDTWQSVEVLVELLDKDGTFVDKCSSYLEGSIGPGQTRNFKVSCSECRDSTQPLVYDRYTIAVVSASFVRPEEMASSAGKKHQ